MQLTCHNLADRDRDRGRERDSGAQIDREQERRRWKASHKVIETQRVIKVKQDSEAGQRRDEKREWAKEKAMSKFANV